MATVWVSPETGDVSAALATPVPSPRVDSPAAPAIMAIAMRFFNFIFFLLPSMTDKSDVRSAA
jgi:hypothetical protein